MNARDHYETLGIGRGATAAEVKSAYYRLVRKHSPEDDPDGFRAISEAYAVLSDPRSRRDYDAEERVAPDIAKALERAFSLCDEKPEQAVAEAERILARARKSPAVRFAVAALMLRAGNAEKALPLAQELVREMPGRPDYTCLLGDLLLANRRLEPALGVLTKAIQLDPERAASYVSLAQVHEALERPDDAIAALDRGVEALGGVSLRTIVLRARKLSVLAQAGRFDEMDRVVTAILSSVPSDDPDGARYAWSQLVWLAQEYDRAGVYDVAKFLFDASLQLVPHDGVAERAKNLAGIAAAQREARRAQQDPRVPRWILALARARIGQGLPEAEFRKLCERLVEEMRTDGGVRGREWIAFRARYPLVAAELDEDWNALHKAGTGLAAPPPIRRTRRRASGSVQRSPRAQSATPYGVVVAVLALVGLLAWLTHEPRAAPQPRFKTLESYVDHMTKNGPKLEDLIRDELVKEQKRRGRPLTAAEAKEHIDGWLRESDRWFEGDLKSSRPRGEAK